GREEQEVGFQRLAPFQPGREAGVTGFDGGNAVARPGTDVRGVDAGGQPRLELEAALGPEAGVELVTLRGVQRAVPAGLAFGALHHGVYPGPVGGLEARRVVAVDQVYGARARLDEQGRPLEGALAATDDKHGTAHEGIEVDDVAGVAGQA